MRIAIGIFLAASLSFSLTPNEIHRLEDELDGYERLVDLWRADGTAYRSIPMYLGIDSAELIIRELRGELEQPRESELKVLLKELRALMSELRERANRPPASEDERIETIHLSLSHNVQPKGTRQWRGIRQETTLISG